LVKLHSKEHEKAETAEKAVWPSEEQNCLFRRFRLFVLHCC